MFRWQCVFLASILAMTAVVSSADELPAMKPLLGERGGLLFKPTFDDPAAEPLHPIAAAKAEIVDGVLRLSKRTDAKHIGVASLWKKGVEPIEDFILEADFCWRGAYGFNFEFKKPGPVKHGEPPEFFITFGKPLPDGEISFEPVEDGIGGGVARIESGGQFSLFLRPGTCRVGIISVQDDVGPGGVSAADPEKLRVAATDAKLATSELEYRIDASKRRLTIEIP